MEKAINEVNEFKGYQDVTAGTMIHILRKYGIETGNIFTYVEKFAIQPDVTMNIKGKIYENKGAFMKLQEILFSPENRGKRFLLVADTGSGKSYAITRIIHTLNEQIHSSTSNQHSSNKFSIYSCPRRALINNLKRDFESDGYSTMLTGSDEYSSLERERIVKNNSSFLTTIDHAPKIIASKLQMNPSNDGIPTLMVTDEVHVLGTTDASFKLDAVRDYLVAERRILDAKGVSLHVTATPENLHVSDYDLIIKINQIDHENPFYEAKYSVLDKSTKELKSQFLRTIIEAATSNKDRKVLIFIEETKWIEDYCKELQKRNIHAIGIMAKKDSERTYEEKMIIDNGVIPQDIQVILSTTVLSSGVSITNNQECDETWVLCSHNSMNHEATRLIQMSHRLRNRYKSFRLFFQKTETPKVKSAFLYHALLKEKIEKAENSKELIMKIRKNPTKYLIRLDEMEQQARLFSDHNGKIHVLTPKIQSDLIRNKTYYNYKNQERLIWELEQRFQCEFSKSDIVLGEEGEETFTEDKTEVSNMTAKEVLKAIINDPNMYVRLRREYVRFGRGGKSVLLKQIKPRTAKEDLLYFIEHGVDYEIVKKVMQCHLKAKKDVTCSYLQDKRALDRLEKMKLADDSSIEAELCKVVDYQLDFARRERREIKFGTITEMDEYLGKLRDFLIKSYGSNPQLTDFEANHLRALLHYTVKSSSKFKTTREFTIWGFKDKKTVLEKYGIERIV
ncbi:DEAD/DEAH box helicase [Niallia circulans]|uniref:DEAD/DEAH box helicase n=1 Tax=Niallia circulans TaxID=1397 RepID=UPI001F453F3F|nr:DEAD/DEAH box helicase [Niallia circulans]MCF2649689.1 DEAD/DEAH box helicase family protein [Niallia circulans]